MKRIQLAIPVIRCLFTAEVMERGPLHPLDVLLLAAVRDGISNPEKVSQEFSLHRNVIDQLIVRLINEDLIGLDFDTDTLRLEGAAISAAKDGTLQSLAFRGSPSQRNFHAFQDLRWGHVIAFRRDDLRIQFGRPSPEAIELARSIDAFDSILSLSPAAISSLFNCQHWLTHNRGRRWMAQGGQVRGTPESRTLLIDFTPYRVADSIDWWPVVQESSRDSSPVWGSLIAQQRQWLQDHPERLETAIADTSCPDLRAEDRRFVPFTSLRCIEQLEAAYLSSSVANDATVRDQWREECRSLHQATMPTKVVSNSVEHVSACNQLLDSAQRWCVVHSAFWSDDGISQYLPAIRNAIERGVQVYLLLGLADDSNDFVVPGCLQKFLADIDGLDGDLFVSQMPTNSHAKVVASDDATVIVSSFNFLGATEQNPQLNLGLIFSKTSQSASMLVGDVVRSITSRPVRDDVSAHLEQQAGSAYEDVIDNPTGVGNSPIDVADNLARLQSALNEARHPCVVWELVEGCAHRDLLLNALHSAKSSVVVTSGDLSRSAVDSVFRSYVSAAIDRGITIRLLWGSQTTESAQRQEAEALARELQETWGDSGYFQMNQSPQRVHSKVVVVDEWVSLVSSYNFLSYRGTRSGAHELGVKVFSATVALQLLRIVDPHLQL